MMLSKMRLTHSERNLESNDELRIKIAESKHYLVDLEARRKVVSDENSMLLAECITVHLAICDMEYKLKILGQK